MEKTEKIAILCSLLIIRGINCLVIEENSGNLENNFSTINETRFESSHDAGLNKSGNSIELGGIGGVVQPNNYVDLDKLLDIWNPMLLIDAWKEPRDIRISRKCDDDISRYFTGLEWSSSWALRMLDASGRPTSGLLSGSKYWIGASDQCREMRSDFVKLTKLNRSKYDDKPDVPPFQVSVNSLRLVLDIYHPAINGSHDITLGLCMPSNCRMSDVSELLYYFSNKTSNNQPRQITIDHVRNLDEGYQLWEDPVFYILLISFVLAIVLVIFGTLYDLALRYQVVSQGEAVRNRGFMGDARVEGAGGVTRMKTMRPEGDIEEEITISRLWSIKQHNASLDVWDAKVVPRPMSEALLSFSLLLNVSKLASLDVGSDTLAPIHGLRFVSILWIIMVHTCLMTNEVSGISIFFIDSENNDIRAHIMPICLYPAAMMIETFHNLLKFPDNKMFRSKAEEDFLYQTISNGTYAVDTFFFISGCLVSFLYFRTMSKQRMKEKKITQGFVGKIMQFTGMMSYRYFRLTPPYLLVIGLVQISTKWYHDHSIIELTTLDHRTCERFWWRNALYVNTYFNMDDRCMVWSWYLANDTQFYTIGIIILIIAASSVSSGAVLGVTILIASWITTTVITFNTRHIPTIQEPFAHYESLYDKPWTRIGPYLIGMAAGWFLCKIDCRLKLSKTVAVIGWILSITILLTIVYGLYGNNFVPISSALYTALSHSGWAISVGFILIACVTGNGGGVEKILSWKYIYPLSRLTYCVYLIHPALMRAIILRGESSFHLTQGFVAIIFFGITVASYAISLFLSLLFEAPMVSLLRIVHPLRQWKQD